MNHIYSCPINVKERNLMNKICRRGSEGKKFFNDIAKTSDYKLLKDTLIAYMRCPCYMWLFGVGELISYDNDIEITELIIVNEYIKLNCVIAIATIKRFNYDVIFHLKNKFPKDLKDIIITYNGKIRDVCCRPSNENRRRMGQVRMWNYMSKNGIISDMELILCRDLSLLILSYIACYAEFAYHCGLC